jgi:hypothetical protein
LSKHQDSLCVEIPADAAERACRHAISEIGWRVLEDDGRRFVAKEITPQATSFTWSAKVEILIEGDNSRSTIRLNGSITGMGPIQKGHLKGQVGALKNTIGVATRAEKSEKNSGDISAELERLADMHKNGSLSTEEFAQAKAQVLDRP